MRFQGALVKEQGITFGIIVVKPHVLHSPSEEESMRCLGIQAFGFVPIVLMAQDSRSTPTYSGRKDIVNFLCSVPIQAIPWREYKLN